MGKKLRYGYGFNKSHFSKKSKGAYEKIEEFMEPFGYGGT
jgi:hypothetical protein